MSKLPASLDQVTVEQLDKFLEYLTNEGANLRKLNQRWATIRADTHVDPIREVLRLLRQQKQMAGVGGKAVGSRLDEAALTAAPELNGKKPLVLYFETAADRDEVATFLEGAMRARGGLRTVKL